MAELRFPVWIGNCLVSGDTSGRQLGVWRCHGCCHSLYRFYNFRHAEQCHFQPTIGNRGHVAAVLVSGIFSTLPMFLTQEVAFGDSQLVVDVIAALSVGLSIFLMVATNTQHPPAAGTVLGLVINGWNWPAVAFVLISALILTIHRLMLGSSLISLL